MTGATVIVRHLSRIRDPKVVSTATSSTFGRMTRLPYHRTLISLTHTRWWEEKTYENQKRSKMRVAPRIVHAHHELQQNVRKWWQTEVKTVFPNWLRIFHKTVYVHTPDNLGFT